jgi:hypothetical protein
MSAFETNMALMKEFFPLYARPELINRKSAPKETDSYLMEQFYPTH